GLAIALAASAAAAELKKTTVALDGPRVTLQLRFDTAVDYHPVYNYAKNLLVVQVKGLKLTRQQLRRGPAIHSTELRSIIISGSFAQGSETGDLRLQLADDVTPGDALLIERENGFDIQFVSPVKAAAGKPSAKSTTKPARAANPAGRLTVKTSPAP